MSTNGESQCQTLLGMDLTAGNKKYTHTFFPGNIALDPQRGVRGPLDD